MSEPNSERHLKALSSADVDPEVVVSKPKPKATRRRLTAEYKRSILEQIDQCNESGAVGALLRSEGLYASQVSTWRRAREQGQLEALDRKRGRKMDPETALRRELEQLRRQNEQLSTRLRKAETIIEVQKKLCVVLGLTSLEDSNDQS